MPKMPYKPISKLPKGKEESKVTSQQRRGYSTLQHGIHTEKSMMSPKKGGAGGTTDHPTKGIRDAGVSAAKRRMGAVQSARAKDSDPSSSKHKQPPGRQVRTAPAGGMGSVGSDVKRDLFKGLGWKKWQM